MSIIALLEKILREQERAAHAHERVRDDGDRDLSHDGGKSPLSRERFEEDLPARRDDGASDVPREEHAAERQLAKGHVAGLGAVQRREEIDRARRGAMLPREAELAYRGVA